MVKALVVVCLLLGILLFGCTKIGQKVDSAIDTTKEQLTPQKKIISMEELGQEIMNLRTDVNWTFGNVMTLQYKRDIKGVYFSRIGIQNESGNVTSIGGFTIFNTGGEGGAEALIETFAQMGDYEPSIIITEYGNATLLSNSSLPFIPCGKRYVVFGAVLPKGSDTINEATEKLLLDSTRSILKICTRVD